MRRILPLYEFVLAAVRCASQKARPGRSSIGSKPSDANGFVLSPVDRHRLPSGPKASEPEEWQHSDRWLLKVRITRSDAMSSASPTTVKREIRVTVESLGIGVYVTNRLW